MDDLSEADVFLLRMLAILNERGGHLTFRRDGDSRLAGIAAARQATIRDAFHDLAVRHYANVHASSIGEVDEKLHYSITSRGTAALKNRDDAEAAALVSASTKKETP